MKKHYKPIAGPDEPKHFKCERGEATSFPAKPFFATAEICKKLVERNLHTHWGGAVAGAIYDYVINPCEQMVDNLKDLVRNQNCWRREAELLLTAKCP